MVKELVMNADELKNVVTVYEADNVSNALSMTREHGITHALVDINLGTTETGLDYAKKITDIKLAIHSSQMTADPTLLFIPKPMDLYRIVEFLGG